MHFVKLGLMQRRLIMKKKNSPKGTTIALFIMAILDIAFTIAMIYLFYLYQAVPDSLIVAVFGVTFGECGFCTLIYKIKKGVNTNGVHGQDLLGETETLCDSRYEEVGDPRIPNSRTSLY